MNIIEREIEKRQAIINSRAEKLQRAEELKKEAETLETEALAIQTDVYEAEIDELKTYLEQEVVEGSENVEG